MRHAANAPQYGGARNAHARSTSMNGPGGMRPISTPLAGAPNDYVRSRLALCAMFAPSTAQSVRKRAEASLARRGMRL
ncbi:hypothetical protein C0Z17_03750 [Trinickia caryophylli]|nr:hypothetical protein C0Z17_03750 [Trinickia caryophylli]